MLSAEAVSFRQQSRLAISLSWIGGFTNVFAFIMWKTFASHMTGASTLLGFYGAGTEWGEGMLYAVLVMSFVAGAISSALMTETARRRGMRSKYTLPLTLEAAILTALVLGLRLHRDPTEGLWRYGLLALTAYAMGLQNATITKISGAVVRSTHLTGVLTDLGIESVQLGLWMWDQMQGRRWRRTGRVLRISQRHPTFLRVALLASIWGSFLFGAVVGTLAYGRCQQLAMVAPVAFLLCIVLIDRRRPIADIRELDVLSDPELKLHGLMHVMMPPELGIYRLTHDPRQTHFRAPNFSMWIDRIPAEKRVVILALSPLQRFDTNAVLNLKRAAEKLEETRRELVIAGVTPVQYRMLAHEGAVEQIGQENICPDLEFAIGRGMKMARMPKRPK